VNALPTSGMEPSVRSGPEAETETSNSALHQDLKERSWSLISLEKLKHPPETLVASIYVSVISLHGHTDG
jgi:hypothetical protein